MLTSGPRSCKNNKFVQIDHTHQEIVCFAKFFNVMNVVYSFEIHFYYIKTYLKGLKDNRFQSFWCLFGVY